MPKINWEKYWNDKKLNATTFEQVERKAENEIVLPEIIKNISKNLDLKPTDQLLDLCCGNGLLTFQLAEKVKNIMAVDVSNNLIEAAKQNHSQKNIQYLQGNALEIDHLKIQKFDKILIYFAFQYFNLKEAKQLFPQLLNLLKPNGKIFLGDVPDFSKRWIFYNSPAKRFYYIKDLIFQSNKMGKFWKTKTLEKITEKVGAKGKRIQQNLNLPHAHYRFDFLIEKN